MNSLDTADAAQRSGQRLRILHIVEAFGGGVYEIVQCLAARHADDGHTVAIAHGIRPETPLDLRAAMPANVELIPMPSWSERSIVAQIRAARRLRRLVPAWSPDVIHLHSSFATIVGAAALSRDVPIVASPHAYSFSMKNQSWLHRAVYRRLEAWAVHRVSLVGAVSESEAQIARSIGAPSVRVVANGIPELDQIDDDAPIPVKPPGAIAIGRAEPQRRPKDCAEILSAVTDIADVKWIGSASTTDVGVQQLTGAGIPITGWLPRPQAMELLSQARAYLHFTAWDGQPLSVLEAMARDTVVIASDIAANREIVGDGQVFATAEEAATHLRRALLDDDYARSLLVNQRRRRGHYSTRRMATEWLNVYRELKNAAA